MSIKDIPQKIKSQWEEKVIPLGAKVKKSFDIKEDIFIILSIILIGLAGFGLGKLSAQEKGRDHVKITRAQLESSPDGEIKLVPLATDVIGENLGTDKLSVSMSATAMIAAEDAKGMLVASKNGTKYHFPWCAGASQIVEKNKIWFNSYEEAKKAGYTPAINCKGLE